MIVNKDIFLIIFDISSAELDDLSHDAPLDEELGWDSMAKVILISEISETMDKVLEADDLESLETAGDLDRLISSLQNSK